MRPTEASVPKYFVMTIFLDDFVAFKMRGNLGSTKAGG
jgi:hypothetical protein